MEAANASIHKYFVDDLSDLMDCMDFGFHQSLGRAMMMRSSALEQVSYIFLNSKMLEKTLLILSESVLSISSNVLHDLSSTFEHI